MKGKFKPFSTTLIGSLPRSKELLSLKESGDNYDKYKSLYSEKLLEETQKVVELQKDCGIDVLVSGELNRDNYMSYVAEMVDGIKLLSMNDLKEITTNLESFNKSLEEMDAADNTMNSPICYSKIDTTRRLNELEVHNFQKFIDRDYKVTLPSPYLLTRSMWLREITGKVYEGRKELGHDVVELLKNEIRHLVQEGVKIIQIDEPILSEVVFTNEKADNSFYWGALSEKVKVDKELKFARELLEPVLEEIRRYEGILSIMHVCRGNWTTDESVLLRGAYDKLGKFFDALDLDMLALEFSTPRAGEVEKLFSNNFLDTRVMLGFGCVNPRSEIIETPEEIVARVEEVLQFLPPERIWLNPDCGFATFSKRPLNPYPIIQNKLENMVKASEILREKYCN